MGLDEVIGREAELAALARLPDRVEAGFAALVLTGEAGIGKTTLWRAGIAAARERSVRVLAASAVEAEATMSFTALGDLLAGAVDEILPELPAPQRRAMERALLWADGAGAEADHRAVAVAFLNGLRALAASGPLLVAVDDVQWLDRASADALGYAARRLREEPVGLLLTRRSDDDAPLPLGLDRAATSDHVAWLDVGPLPLGGIRELLRSQLGLGLPRTVLHRIHEQACGNPFYALELARVVDRGHAGAGEPIRLSRSLGELVRGRIAALPDETRAALLVAAALAEPRLDTVASALPGRRLRPFVPRSTPR
jgi:predicted ATPase